MSKESKKKEKGGKEGATSAVLLAESWTASEAVVGRAWGLTPLANVALLHHSLEALSRLDPPLKEVVLASGAEEGLEEVLAAWEGRWEAVRLLKVPGADSLGDVLRAVDERGDVSGDFVLVEPGALPPPAHLAAAIAEHKGRRSKDKAAVLTLLLGQGSVGHPGKLSGPEPLIGTGDGDEATRVRYYEELTSADPQPHHAFEGTLRRELLATGVSICSAQIPPLFTGENVDFRSLGDAVREILTNEEIHGFKAHVATLPETASPAFVRDLASLVALSPLLLQGWFSPHEPDSVTADGLPRVRRLGKGRFVPQEPARRPSLASATIDGGCVLGGGVKLGRGVVLRNSVLGDGVEVGDGCVLDACVLMSCAKVGPGCLLSQSLLLPDSQLPAKATAGPFSVLSTGAKAKLKPGAVFPASSVVLDHKAADSAGVKCAGGSGALSGLFEWRSETGTSLAERRSASLLAGDWAEGRRAAAAADPDDSDEDLANAAAGGLRQAAQAFFAEVSESLERGLSEKTSAENLRLEINSSKFAYNVRMEELCQLLARALVELSAQGASSTSAASAAFVRNATQLRALLLHYLSPDEDAQVDFLTGLEETLLGSATLQALYLPGLAKLLHFLYDADVLTEDAILSWHRELEEESAEVLGPRLEAFVRWLQEADEDSD